MKKKRENSGSRIPTTFAKLTLGFIFIGVIPIFLISVAIFANYYNKTSEVMISNYSQITEYFARNVEGLFESVDAVMAELYDYETDEGSLDEIIKDEEMKAGDRNLYMVQMLRELISMSEYISSERFVDSEGRVYSLFYDQNKTLRNDAADYNQLMTVDEQVHDLMVYSMIEEQLFCVNTDDYIFTLSRNFMDTGSVEKIGTDILGTFYIDVNVEEIEDMIAAVGVTEGEFFLYDPQTQEYLYSPNAEDYGEDHDSLQYYVSLITADEGNVNENNHRIFFEQVGDTGFYAVLVLDDDEILNSVLGNTTMLLLVLCFVAFLLLGLYMFFMRQISQPIAALRTAMEKVQKGDLTVRANVTTKDEMKYVAEGFNQMVEDLQKYIDQVYVAQICQKEAELNALKMQIQPHYLYNTLDIIRMTALENEDEETAELLESLAFQLRYLLGPENDQTTIREEVRMLQEYFVLIKKRYQGRIELTVNVTDEAASLYVPKMLFQPIVENSVKHGLRFKKGRGRVMLDAARKGDILEVSIMDDGIGMSEERVVRMQEALDVPKIGYVDPESGVSVGTKNVYDRIKLSCGKEYGFTIYSAEGMGTIVTFRLPVWTEIQERSMPKQMEESTAEKEEQGG